MRVFIIGIIVAVLFVRFCVAAVDVAIETAQERVDNHLHDVSR